MWILLAIIAVMPFEANPYLYLGERFLGIFPDFTIIKLLGLIGLGWVVLQMAEGRTRVRVFDSSQGRVFIVYLALVVFAVVASGASLGRLTRILSIVFFFPLVLTAVQSKDNLGLALKTATGILILVFPYAYRQVIRFGGRLGVGLYEPNYLAMSLVMVLPLAVAFARQETVGWKRSFWVCGTGILFLEIIMAASRGAFLGLLVILPLIAFRLMKRRALALSVMACLVLVPVFVIPSNMGHRILASGLSEEVQDNGIKASNVSRMRILRAGLRMMLENPIAGVGLGNFKPTLDGYSDIPVSKIAHNTYLEVGAELGVGAIVAFLLVIYSTFGSLRRSERLAEVCGNKSLRDLAVACQIGFTGYLVSAMFLSAQFEKFFWLLLFLTICFERIVKKEAQSQSSVVSSQSSVRSRQLSVISHQ